MTIKHSFMTRNKSALAFAKFWLPLAMLGIGVLTFNSSAFADSYSEPETSASNPDLSSAPRIDADSINIEEGYLSDEQSREQAALDHANRPYVSPEEETRRRRYSDETQVVETGVRLSRDDDRDGYYSRFNLEIDVDTRDQLEVYADIYLQLESESPRWLHSTRSFHLYGNSDSDEYGLEVTLTDNFPAGHYDLIIEIRDAWSDQLLDSVSEAHFRNLGSLPLEDESYRGPRNDGSALVVEYTGATTPIFLIMLALVLLGMRQTKASKESRMH